MFTNIISAIGNNSSIYPLLVRDCGIEIPAKIALTYDQNVKESKKIAKLASRERFIDEYAVSAVWLGGIPLIDWISKKIMAKSFNSDVNMKLITEEKNKKQLGEEIFQGIEYNIKEFKTKAPDAIRDLEKVLENPKKFQRYTALKFVAATTIPIAFMGFILPKLVFASSGRKIAKQREKERQANYQINYASMDTFLTKNKDISFKGNLTSSLANFTTVQKMAAVDGGYAVGRVATARNKNESLDVGFKMAGMMFLNFVAPKWIEKGLNKLTGAKLDPIMLADNDFIKEIQSEKIRGLSSASGKELLDFIDQNPNSLFVKYADKLKKIKMLEGNKAIRDPRAYVDMDELTKFKDNIAEFAEKMASVDVKKLIRKTKSAKTFSILTNVALSSFLLAYCLPKTQFALRKFITGSNLEPGLAPAEKS